MELRQLCSVVAVAGMGNTSRAAQKLFLTRPALSRQIEAREDERSSTSRGLTRQRPVSRRGRSVGSGRAGPGRVPPSFWLRTALRTSLG
ncbi:MAG: LysR family transcriptional regulator [Verrucomicrobia bacterium]|nr:LysR family transcriptional regulator [Verrucomicrobiota bacterium]